MKPGRKLGETEMKNNIIDVQEDLDYYVASRCMEKMIPYYHICSSPRGCSVDLYGMNNRLEPFCVEIKERIKSKENLEKYPWAELKVEKLNRMRLARSGKLYYMTLLNEEICYLWDMDKIDWDKVGVFEWEIKNCQMSSYSSKSSYMTYQIPFSMAIDSCYCGDYFYDWYKTNYGLD